MNVCRTSATGVVDCPIATKIVSSELKVMAFLLKGIDNLVHGS